MALNKCSMPIYMPNHTIVPVNSLHDVLEWSSVSDMTQAEKSWMSRLRKPKLATIGHGRVYEPVPGSSLGI